MNTSKAAVVVSTIVGKVCSILGYSILVVFGLPLIFGAFGSDSAQIIFVLVCIGLGTFLIVLGIKNKHRIKRFKIYVGLISMEHMTSLENIASSTSQSIDFVSNDIQKMIDKKFFANANIDKMTNEIIIGETKAQPQIVATPQPAQQNTIAENENVKCQGCGAMNLKQKGVAINCEYCGSPIK